jgi:hypothetical protein
MRAEWLFAYNAAYRAKPRKPELILLKEGDEFYPDPKREGDFLLAHLVHADVHLALAVSGRPQKALLEVPGEPQSDTSGADLRFKIEAKPYPALAYVIDTGAIRFTASATIAPDAWVRSGAISSYPDLERASAIIWVGYHGVLFPPSYPVEVRLRSASRSYVVVREQMRPIPMYWPVFSLPPLTPRRAE